ncbi:MAG TPA: S1 RNA-binding domain-containing protein, partial [Candidatus Atribacteria bacterium]|nr:S1 RNA-binding domain-containing protein [Candidatus Atribacteria bacterium]
VLKEGQEVKVKVIKIDDQEKKIGLSIKQASQEEEKEHASSDGRITLGDMVGSKLTDLLNSLKK